VSSEPCGELLRSDDPSGGRKKEGIRLKNSQIVIGGIGVRERTQPKVFAESKGGTGTKEKSERLPGKKT